MDLLTSVYGAHRDPLFAVLLRTTVDARPFPYKKDNGRRDRCRISVCIDSTDHVGENQQEKWLRRQSQKREKCADKAGQTRPFPRSVFAQRAPIEYLITPLANPLNASPYLRFIN